MNRCGTCTACCTVLGVREIRKDDYEACQHCVASGCQIYDKRPKECQTYQCLWLSSRGVPEHRPDRLGVILEATETNLGDQAARAIVVREAWEGAAEQDYVRGFVDRIAHNFDAYIYVVRENGTRGAFFPPWVAHLAKYAQCIVEKSWRDVERAEEVEKRRRREAKKRAKRKRKQVSASKKRNR